jgi:hypothetical protein
MALSMMLILTPTAIPDDAERFEMPRHPMDAHGWSANIAPELPPSELLFWPDRRLKARPREDAAIVQSLPRGDAVARQSGAAMGFA